MSLLGKSIKAQQKETRDKQHYSEKERVIELENFPGHESVLAGNIKTFWLLQNDKRFVNLFIGFT